MDGPLLATKSVHAHTNCMQLLLVDTLDLALRADLPRLSFLPEGSVGQHFNQALQQGAWTVKPKAIKQAPPAVKVEEVVRPSCQLIEDLVERFAGLLREGSRCLP